MDTGAPWAKSWISGQTAVMLLVSSEAVMALRSEKGFTRSHTSSAPAGVTAKLSPPWREKASLNRVKPERKLCRSSLVQMCPGS